MGGLFFFFLGSLAVGCARVEPSDLAFEGEELESQAASYLALLDDDNKTLTMDTDHGVQEFLFWRRVQHLSAQRRMGDALDMLETMKCLAMDYPACQALNMPNHAKLTHARARAAKPG